MARRVKIQPCRLRRKARDRVHWHRTVLGREARSRRAIHGWWSDLVCCTAGVTGRMIVQRSQRTIRLRLAFRDAIHRRKSEPSTSPLRHPPFGVSRVARSEQDRRSSAAPQADEATAEGREVFPRDIGAGVEEPPPRSDRTGRRAARSTRAGYSATSAPSVFPPRPTTTSASSGNGRCSALASSHGARIQTSISSVVVRITGIAFGWIGATTAFGSVVRKP